MAFMLASAAISGVGLFVYRHSNRLHTACSNLLSDYETRDSDDGISRKRRRVRRPEASRRSERPSPNTAAEGDPEVPLHPEQTSPTIATEGDPNTSGNAEQPLPITTVERDAEVSSNTEDLLPNMTVGRYPEGSNDTEQPSTTTTVERDTEVTRNTEQPLPNMTVGTYPEGSSDTEQPSSNITVERDTEVTRHTEQPPRIITLGREPDTEVDNTSAIYENQVILADVAEYIESEDSAYNAAAAVSANNEEEDDFDFVAFLDKEARRPGMEPTGSASNNQQVEYDIAAYLAMDDSDQDMEPATSTNNNQQVESDIAAYLAMDDSDQDMEPAISTNNKQKGKAVVSAYVEKDDSSSSGDRSAVTVVRFVEPEKPERSERPEREEDDFWLRPLVYNKKQPGPSPSVSSVGDIFEELGISPLDLNDGYEDDEPKITWVDDDELDALVRGLSQRYQSIRAGKQPAQAPRPDPTGRIEQLLALPSVETLKISDESKAAVESMQAQAAETRLVDRQREKLAKERLQREQALQKLKERTAKGPRQPMVSPLSNEWIEKIINTIEVPEAEVVATTCQGIPLRKHDFATVVAAKTWLNDEIVNGALAELEKQINLAAGITDYKQQGRKCLVMNSFFWPRVKEAGGKKTQSILRRMGVTPKNLLLMDTILVPICQDYHWTVLVVQPKQRKVMHLDSFNRRSPHTDLALAWMSDYLGDLYHAKPWQVMALRTPQQNNGYDCGVHVITNGICLALGLDPLKSYNGEDMPLQRLRIAGMLLNGGFVGDFDLWQQ
ncbi:hypothetical protein V8C42DRAFT_313714 [Trichoderma barbatum]